MRPVRERPVVRRDHGTGGDDVRADPLRGPGDTEETVVGSDVGRGERPRDGGPDRHVRGPDGGPGGRPGRWTGVRLGGGGPGGVPVGLPQGAGPVTTAPAGVGTGTAGGVPAGGAGVRGPTP